MRIRTVAITALLLLVAFGIAGCGSDDGDSSGSDRGDAASERDASERDAGERDASEGDEEAHGDDSSHEDDKAGDDAAADKKPAPKSFDESFAIVFENGAVRGGPQVMRAGAGDTVRIEIRSDAEDEVHVHGIDAEAEIAAGRTTALSFAVDARGSYEVELHDSGVVLGSVEVR